MKTLGRAIFITSIVLIPLAAFMILTMNFSTVLHGVDAATIDQFLQKKHAVYEALNRQIPTVPKGVVRTNPDYRMEILTPKFQIWPPDNHIQIAAGTGAPYTYDQQCQFELDLEHATFAVTDYDEKSSAAKALLDYYTAPLTKLGFQCPGPGYMSGKTQLIWGTWSLPNDPSIEVVARVFVAPESKDAIVWIEIHERLIRDHII